ncbi:MFS transporter [Jannaschia seohaensis]|uniref:Predicted arabinose efflux permease, MFS family n=1 Tax=Jannaschia seohaensis TaxID=475081 RepID=A0A2Y9ACV0_9RHOB|nr:MFS transporter [Jannaschia seohaensis]PWJ21429.1 putative MFS family arabinose efflux permease [Jannaschia seohaensis]SSA42035.1 Predicted arabinose efflux permease, MFS family [Jannaschia seohaensis]
MADPVPTLAVFRNPAFRNLWVATLASNFGGIVQAIGAAWLMTSLTSSESMVALVQSSVTLPIMIFSLAAGVFADNFDRRKVMLGAQAFMCVSSIGLAFLAFEGWLTPWLLLAFTFLIGCGTALNNPSWQATVGDLVSKAELPAAVSVNSIGFNMMRSVGPAAGGAIVAAFGAAAAFAVNAASYIAIIAALFAWKPKPKASRLPREAFGSAFAAGLRYVAMSPGLVRTILRAFLFGLSAIALQALLPVIVRDTLGGTSLTYGLLLGAFGVGAVAGAMANQRLRQRFENEAIIRIAFGGYAICYLALALSPPVVVAGAVLFLAGSCWVIALSLLNTTIQLSTPRWVVGRVLALYQTGTFGGMAAGSWLWGALAEGSSMGVALIGAGVAMGLGLAFGFLSPMPDRAEMRLDPAGTFVEPTLSLDIQPRSGPVMVMVDFTIDEADVPRFLALMADRRRIRIRDGAGQWTLLRDMENPDIWTESYHVPTWVEYIRHHERRTEEDIENFKQLRALHRGPEPIRVHRMIERHSLAELRTTPGRRASKGV